MTMKHLEADNGLCRHGVQLDGECPDCLHPFAVGDCVGRKHGTSWGYVLSVTPIANGGPDDLEIEWHTDLGPLRTKLYADAVVLISAEREGDNPVQFS